MPKKVTITVPDDMRVADVADYVEFVAQQIDDGYLSGHVAVDHYWEASPL